MGPDGELREEEDWEHGQAGRTKQAGLGGGRSGPHHYVTSTQQSSNASEGLQRSEGPCDMPTRGHSMVRSGHWSS